MGEVGISALVNIDAALVGLMVAVSLQLIIIKMVSVLMSRYSPVAQVQVQLPTVLVHEVCTSVQ